MIDQLNLLAGRTVETTLRTVAHSALPDAPVITDDDNGIAIRFGRLVRRATLALKPVATLPPERRQQALGSMGS